MGQGISVEEAPNYNTVIKGHGILGALAWVIFFPLGAILLRVMPGSKAWLVHAAIMMFGMVLFTANAGMGIWQASGAYDEYHAIVGLVLFILAWMQPVGGLVHHFLYQKYDRRTVISFLHMSIGRAVITVGMIEGGLGLMYGGDGTRAQNIAYGVIAGVVWATYFIISFWSADKREVQIKSERDGAKGMENGGKLYES